MDAVEAGGAGCFAEDHPDAECERNMSRMSSVCECTELVYRPAAIHTRLRPALKNCKKQKVGQATAAVIVEGDDVPEVVQGIWNVVVPNIKGKAVHN
ncbi:hypothetical protein HK100_007378 [Physocladia obscura]|uniref:Uncharacterized protein n=1 Tax=Physocladia obscura TaxID=109957 RepID=A0AAD5T4Y0_9FUNG|nr:hypothetical protein HK100_007378 [Physocladia obscura]